MINPQELAISNHLEVKAALKRSKSPDSLVALQKRLNEHIADEFVATLKEYKEEVGDEAIKFPCYQKCSWCCHLRVTAYPHEAVAIIYYLNTKLDHLLQKAILERLRINADQITEMSRSAHLLTNVECAFLVNGECAVYPVRPIMCAKYHSMNASECEYSFNHPEDDGEGKPEMSELTLIGDATIAGIEQGLNESKIEAERHELNTLSYHLISDPKAPCVRMVVASNFY